MLNRRDFLGASIVTSATAVAGPSTALSSFGGLSPRLEAVFLARPIGEWFEVWRSGTPDVWAARAVRAFGPWAIPALLEMLPRKGPPLPTPQLPSVIARIAKDDPQVVDQLLELSRSDFFRTAEVLKRCCGTHPSVARYFLQTLLTEDCPRKHAIALAALGYDCDRSEFIHREDFAQAVIRFIDRAVAIWNEGAENIIRHGLESAWEFIADLNCPAAEMCRLCELLIQTSTRNDDPDLYLDPSMLEQLGPEISSVIAKFATSHDTRSREEEIERLIDTALSDPEADQQLAQLVQADDEDVAIHAVLRVQTLRLDSPEIVEALGHALRTPGQTNWRRRHVVCEALANLGTEALPLAITAIGGECPGVRHDAINLLGQLGRAAKSVLPTLRFHWHAGDPRHRAAILRAMIAISPDDWLLPFIHEGLEAWDDPDLCSAAVSGLYQFGQSDNRQFLPKLLRMLTCEQTQFQELAAQSISRCGNEWLSEVLKLAESPEPLARVGVVLALGNCPMPAPQVVSAALRRAVNDRDLAVRYQARAATKSLQVNTGISDNEFNADSNQREAGIQFSPARSSAFEGIL